MVGGWKDGASNSVVESRMLGVCDNGVAAGEVAAKIRGRMLGRCMFKARRLSLFKIFVGCDLMRAILFTNSA